MDISDFLSPDRVSLDVRARDKGALITEVARQFARTVSGVNAQAVETALLAREQLGSTGLGGGFALPHARLDGLETYVGSFVRMSKPIEFDAIDAKPVSLVFVLLIPFETATPHVAALAAISRRFRDAALVLRLRKVKTPAEAYGFLTTN
jgi:nitrogen PTS system EIIA component